MIRRIRTERNHLRGGTCSSFASRAQLGFTMLEVTMVMSMMLIGSSMFFMNLKPALDNAHVANAYDTVLGAIRRAHDEAVTENRTYVVSFVGPRTINVNETNPGGTLLFSINLPSDISFDNEAGIPTSPAPFGGGYGTGNNAVDFDQCCGGGGTVIYFQPDGTAHDAVGNLNNGVIYIARPGQLNSSHALTLTGATGRLRGWRLSGNTWTML